MTKGMSLHIGVRNYKANYADTKNLPSALYDAAEMYGVAQRLGYVDAQGIPLAVWDGRLPAPPNVLIDDDATLANVREHLKALDDLKSGDAFLLTFSGHGGQFDDDLSTEPDHRDEAICLFKGMLIDREMECRLRLVPSGARVFMVLDSCNSADFAVVATVNARGCFSAIFGRRGPAEHREVKGLTEAVAFEQWFRIQDDVNSVISDLCPGGTKAITAYVAEFSACREFQMTPAGDGRGLSPFTDAFKEVWKNGAFSGSCASLVQDIDQVRADINSTPCLTVRGPDGSGLADFLRATPFII